MAAGNTAVLANFGFVHARVLFFVHNDFPCGTNNLRKIIYLPAIGGISRRNGGKTAVFLTFSLIMLEFWFLDLMNSHVVQIILENRFARHWRYKPL